MIITIFQKAKKHAIQKLYHLIIKVVFRLLFSKNALGSPNNSVIFNSPKEISLLNIPKSGIFVNPKVKFIII